MSNRAERMRQLNANPAFRKKRLEKLKVVNDDPEFQKRRIKAIKAYSAKPEVKWLRSERMKRQWKDPEFRQAQIKKIKQLHRDPGYRKRRSDGLKRAMPIAFNKPELREKRRLAAIRMNSNPKYNPLAVLNPYQKKIYKLLRRKGCPRDEAIRKASKRKP